MCLSDGLLLAPFVSISIYHIDRISTECQKETGERRSGEGPPSPLSLIECAQAIKRIRRNTGYRSPKLYKSVNCQVNSTQITFARMMGLPDRSLSTQCPDGLLWSLSITIVEPAFLIVLPVLFLCLLLLATAFWWLVYKPSTRLERWLERLYMLTGVKKGQGRH